MKIGVLYIALGRYHIFWKDFFESSEKYFLTDCDKHYFLFTDSEELKKKYNHIENVTVIHHQKRGWPYDTLMRFEIFLQVKQELEKMDYVYFFNANMEFVDKIGIDEFLPKEEGLSALNHPWFYNCPREKFAYETNPKSLAYIADEEGKYYFMGSLNGGKSKDYLKLIETLDKNIKIDLQNDIIAIWHDESHLNKYLLDKKVFVLPPVYGYPEEKLIGGIDLIFNRLQYRKKWGGVKVVMTDKDNYRFGGRDWLRKQPYKNTLVENISFLIAREKIRFEKILELIQRKIKKH